MLTGDLVRVRVDGAELRPSFVGEPKPALREQADALIDAFRAGVEAGWARGRLDEEIDAVIGDSRDHKLLRGLAKVLLDRSELETSAPMDPVELRALVFRKAREKGPLALERGPLDRPVADDVLAEVAAELGHPIEAIRSGLYADRVEEQKIVSCTVTDPDELLRRYDVALAQAVLLHATQVKVTLTDPPGPRLRQLFRWIKFHQLVHHAARVGEDVVITLDGPMSLFKQSTRYGMQLATFLPALLLQERWVLEAEVVWTARKLRKRLVLTPGEHLASSLPDTGAYATREQQWFAERWAALDTPWEMTDRTDPIDLGGRAVLLPDFTFRNGARVGHLEIVGFWRRDWLEKRMALVERYGPGNLVIAVSRKLQASQEDLPGFAGAVIQFAEIVPPKAVIEALEKVAR